MVNPLENLAKYSVILASGSPRRSELLSELGINFSVKKKDGIDESYPKELAPLDVAKYISCTKAYAYLADISMNDLVITADTIVALGEKILGKPKDHAEAVAMLRFLSGKTHEVVTGVTCMTKDRKECFADVSFVTFAPMNDEEIEYYVDTFRPYDKAGAYGIQEWIGLTCVSKIEGSFYNVMGLPVQKLYSVLRTF